MHYNYPEHIDRYHRVDDFRRRLAAIMAIFELSSISKTRAWSGPLNAIEAISAKYEEIRTFSTVVSCIAEKQTNYYTLPLTTVKGL